MLKIRCGTGVEDRGAREGGRRFVRSHRGLSPPERAARLQPYADTMVATPAAFLRIPSANPAVIEGTVRITTAEVIAIQRFPSILVALRRANPALEIELEASDGVGDLLGRQADIAIRMIEPVQQAPVARRAGTSTVGLFAHPDYLDGKSLPNSPAELGACDLIGMDDAPAFREIFRAFPDPARHGFAVRTNTTLAQVAAIRAGFGIGVCQVAPPRAVRRSSVCGPTPSPSTCRYGWRCTRICARMTRRTVFDALVAGLARSPAADLTTCAST